MEITPYSKNANTSEGMTFANLTRLALMDLYQAQNPNASEMDIALFRDEIEALITAARQEIEKSTAPMSATIKLAEKQCVSLGQFGEKLTDEIMHTDNIDVFLNENAEMRKQIDTAIEELPKDARIKPYDALFQQTITAYKGELYDLAILGFFAIFDGLLSDITEDRCSVTLKERTEKAVATDESYIPEDNEALNTVFQKVSLLTVVELLSKRQPFNGTEPETLNRHWAMHGRTRTKKTKLDCEKLILLIYALMSATKEKVEK